MNFNDTYKSLIQQILDTGITTVGRNGNTLAVPFASFTVNAKDWRLNLRRMRYKGVEGEFNTLMDLDNPLKNVKQFENNGCNYWSQWAAEDGSLNLAYYNRLHPQLEDVIENIKKEPRSRRHVVSLWDHDEVESGELSLPSCWEQMIFTVLNNDIHITWVNRSLDVYYGLPADLYLAKLFLQHVAGITGYQPGNINFVAANVHLYTNQIAAAQEVLTRTEADWDTPIKGPKVSV